MSGGEPMTATLRAGYAKVDITPNEPVPLAGIAGLRERLSTEVRDPLWVRAAALARGKKRVVVVSADLLTPLPGFHEAVLRALGGRPRSELFLACTHTHSAPGGYWAKGPGRLFMGRERPGLRNHLVASVARAVHLAEADLAPARPFRGRSRLTGLTGNRRTFRGPVDEELGLLRLEVTGGLPIDILSMAGHPVIGAELEPTRVSGDYPGVLVAALEEEGSRPLFLTGAAAGTSILFPEFDQGMDRHLELVVGLLSRGVDRAVARLTPAGDGGLRAEIRDIPLGPVDISHFCPPVGAGWRLREGLLSPVRALWRRLVQVAYQDVKVAPVHGVFVGDTALLGFPAEVGPTITLRAREMAREHDFIQVLPASHCDSYIGYVHLPADYFAQPGKGYSGMAIYENAMAFFGPDTGLSLLHAVEGLLRGPGPSEEPCE